MGGTFLLSFASGPRIDYASVEAAPNYLAYRAHAAIFSRALNGGSTATFRMGFCGAEQRLRNERPNWMNDAYEMGRSSQLSDFEYGNGNEGGVYSDSMRALLGYTRQDVTWVVTPDYDGGLVDTGWHKWGNPLIWNRSGSWAPQPCTGYAPFSPTGCWPYEILGTYNEPYKWIDCAAHEADVNYPWCSPRIHQDWWRQLYPPNAYEVQYNNPYGVDCADCVGHTAWSIGAYPIGAAFVTITAGSSEELFACCRFAAPIHWRFGAELSIRYVARYGRRAAE